MITIPDRLAAITDAIERGEAVDYRKVALLQSLDLVRAGRQFVEDAIELHEDETAATSEWLRQQNAAGALPAI